MSVKRFLQLLELRVPRTLSSESASTWFIFTGASHELESDHPAAGMGAVLVDCTGRKVRIFSAELNEELLAKINVSCC